MPSKREVTEMLNGKYVILLDAGHYSYYNQGIVKTYWESINNWTQVNMLKNELEKRGFVVYTTRKTQETDLALYDRGYQCKKYNADLFLSIHSNAPGGNHPEVKGVAVYYSWNADTQKLANDIATNIAGVMGNGINSVYCQKSNNGDYNYFGVLRGAYAAGCKKCFILERGFHTNETECSWLMDNNNLRKLAIAQADFWENYFYGKKENISMRYFKLLTNMNIRQTPNGEILGVLKSGTEVSGTELTATDSGTQWLNIEYNNQSAYVAVLPKDKGYAEEIINQAPAPAADYKALYEAEKTKVEQLNKDYNALKLKYDKAVADIKAINNISKQY